MIGPHSTVIVKYRLYSTQMRREPRRSKGHNDNSRNAQAAALTATGLSTGHSAQATAAQATEQAAAIAAARRRQHWPQQASALATARRRQHWPQRAGYITGCCTGHSTDRSTNI